ncbi:MAG: DUF502 domain-containing protein [Sedimentisphaerales bacterium]|nr:DUF502 domain-containing protein [Sedimentisphaerales bacterium]
MRFAKGFKTYFLRGLAVLLPTILTLWMLLWGYRFIQETIAVHINRGLVRIIMLFQGPEGLTRQDLTQILVDGPAGSVVGFIIAVIAVCLVGAFIASVMGKTIWRLIEKFIMNTPVLRRIYPYVKQVTDFLLTREQQERLFSKVVAVEYPRKGIWSMGFVTGSGLRKVVENVEKEFLTVLIPTSPTPLTGFVIMVPKEQTIDLDMTIEEAVRFTVSAGVITPQIRDSRILLNNNVTGNENVSTSS